MIVLFTDFGVSGPYIGQMKAVIWAGSPGLPIVDLMSDLPAFQPQAAAYLLAAYAGDVFPAGSVFLCVVDPGVGSARPMVAARVDGRWFVAPGNGVLELLLRRGRDVETFRIVMPAGPVSASFHGRDIFAPVARRLASGSGPVEAGLLPDEIPRYRAWPDDLPAVVYVDHFGNLLTGLRAASLDRHASLKVAGKTVAPARTFSDVAIGTAFWYENANGLAEIAVNCGRADAVFGCGTGAPVDVIPLT